MLAKQFGQLACAALLASVVTPAASQSEPLTPTAREFYNALVYFMQREQIMKIPLDQVDAKEYPSYKPYYDAEYQAYRVELAGTRGRLREYAQSEGKLSGEICRQELAVYYRLDDREKLVSNHDSLVSKGRLPGPAFRDMMMYNYAQSTLRGLVSVLNTRCEL